MSIHKDAIDDCRKERPSVFGRKQLEKPQCMVVTLDQWNAQRY